MAAGTSFKQQCPSCEAMVPIRDAGLIGRKIDCPKCKYRFLVEEPPVDEDEDDAGSKKKSPAKTNGKANGKDAAKAGPRRRGNGDDDAAGDKPAKKKTGNSSMLLIGGGIGLASLVAIAVCAWAFLGGDGGSGTSSTPLPSSGGSSGGMASAPDASTPPAGEQADAAKKPVESVLVNVSNFLPNDTQAIIAYPMPMTLGSALKAAAITEAEGGFKPERFRQTMGIELDDLNRVINGVNAKDGWIFSLVQSKKPLNQDVMKTQLRLSPQAQVKGKSGKMHDVYLVQSDLDSLSNLLIKFNQPRETFHAHFLDANTVVFADPAPMKRFLEADAKPDFLTKDGPAAAPLGGTPAAGTPGGGVAAGPPMGTAMAMKPGGGMGAAPTPGMMAPPGGSGPPMSGGMMPPGMMSGAPGGSAAPTTGQASGSTPSSWMSVDPSLKMMLDRIEKLEENKATTRKEPASVVTIVGLVDPLHGPLMGEVNKQLADKELDFLQRMVAQQVIGNELKRIQTVGASLVAFDQRRADVTLAMEYRERRDAERVDRQIRPLLALAPPVLKSALGLSLTVPTPTSTQPGFGGMMGGMSGMPMPGPGGMSSPIPGGMGRGPGGGGGVASDGAAPPPGAPSPGLGGFAGAPGFPGTAGGTGTNPTDDRNDGKLALTLEDRMLVGVLEMQLTAEAYDKLMGPTKEAMQWVKAQADLTSTRSRVHDLAAAFQAYFKDKGQFPPGVMPRSSSVERGIPWRPDQRLSWVVALLPYLGDDFKDWKVDPEMSWNEGKNLLVGTRIVPALIGNRNVNSGALMITYPGIPDVPLSITQFVGIAGLGYDAAEYKMGDPNTAKKIGLFGYDRVVRKADVKDGLDKTIAFLMVSGDHKAPWLAGGGATVRAVSDGDGSPVLSTPGGAPSAWNLFRPKQPSATGADDTRPIAPFLCTTYPGKPGEKTKWDGKKGTIAIMADGKVRFIPEDLPPATFRALCTISGEESIDRLDTLCPVIEPQETKESRPAPVLARPTPPGAPGAPVVSGGPIPTGWKESPNAAGKYTVVLPAGTPIQSKINLAGMEVQVNGVQTADGKRFIVTFQEIPAVAASASADELFEGAKAGMLASAQGSKFSSEKPITIDGNPGRDMVITLPMGEAHNRLLKVGQRIYVLTAGFPTGQVDQAAIKGFFDSFRISK